MKKMECKIAWSKRELREKIGRFHFQETDLLLVSEVYQKMQKLLQIHAYYAPIKKCLREEKGAYQYVLLVTLGVQIDELLEYYSQQEKLSEAYIVECLSMLFLSDAYEKAFARIEVDKQQRLCEFAFLEEVYDLSVMQEMINQLPKIEITCDMNMLLHPSKSAMLLLKLEQQQHTGAGENCRSRFSEHCKNCRHKCNLQTQV